MRTLGLVISAAVGFMIGNGAASAADLPVKAPPAPVVMLPNWTGFYVGGSVGGAGGERDFVFDTAGTAPLPNPHGFKGGAAGALFFGGQYQWDKFVLGVEAGYNLLDLNNTDLCPNVAFNCRTSANQLWTVGPRLGFALDQFLIYGTGGYADTKTGYLAQAIATGATFDSAKNWVGGWFAGGGLEWIVPNTNGLILGVDYKHIQTDQQSVTPFLASGLPSPVDHFLMTSHIDTVQLRLSYKWGWVNPVVAKY